MQVLTQSELPKVINVIGNATSLLDKEYGSLIDKHPTIRFNRVEIVNPIAQGSRWDYLASSEINTFEKYNEQSVPFHSVIFTPTSQDVHYKSKKIKFKTSVYLCPIHLSLELFSKLEAIPSTGLQILYYLQSIGHKSVNVFGFDWKATPTMYEKRNKGKHDFDKERVLVLDIIHRNNWSIYH